MKNLTPGALFICLLLCVHSLAQNSSETKSLSAEQWREDLKFLVTQIQNTHPNPFFKSSKDTFMETIQSLHKRIPEMTDNEIVVEMMRLTSLLKDGHTKLFGKNLTKLWFPVRVYEFEDGIFITAIHPDYIQTLGAKIIKIGKYPVDEAFRKIKEITPHDNEYSLNYNSPIFLTMSSILKGLDIIDDQNYLNLTIEKEGKISALSLPAAEFESDDDFMWYWMFNGVPAKECVRYIDLDKSKAPMVYRNLEHFYWFEYLEETHTVYMCFNLCLDSPNEQFSDFNARLWKLIESKNAKHLVIDLRNNIGGNNQILLPLIHDVIRHENINRKGNFFALIGRKTWSAAMHCASWLERHTNVSFIGEPTASAPNHYADPHRITLPNSKIDLLVSRYYWQNSWPWDERDYIEPGEVVKLYSHQYFNYIDPVIELILNRLKQDMSLMP